MALSEIEKLERRYAENPQGLTFAPLAEVHRKNGEVTRALELLRAGLELHPNYIPASIVLGRCHLDLSDLPAAEAAFTHVLTLDGENVIALKALADISERQHRFDQAERWLRTLLSVDRSNDDARAQLERIEHGRRDSGAAPAVPALEGDTPATMAATASEPVGESEPVAESEAVVESEPDAPVEATTEAVAGEPAVIEPAGAWVSTDATEEVTPLPLADLETDYPGDEGVEPPPPGLLIEEPEALEAPVEPLEGIVGRDVDSAEIPLDEFRVEQSEDIILRSSGGNEFQVPDASLELSDRMTPAPPPSPFGQERPPMFGGFEEVSTAPEPAPAVEPPSEIPSPVAAAAPEPVQPEASVLEAAAEVPPPPPTDAPAPDVIVAPEPEPIVTETMAEVLLQQGHSAEALRVYRELEVQRSGDPRIRERIAAIEEETRTAISPTPRRQYTASETGGQSVADFFRGLLGARPPAMASAPVARPGTPQVPADAAGAPTRPAADALSLSSVFGEETTPLPPAMPAAGATQSAGVSFDEFYGTPGQGAAGHKARGPDPKNDDLDQFHAWLQNLKR